MLISLARLYAWPVKKTSRLRHDRSELKKDKQWRNVDTSVGFGGLGPLEVRGGKLSWREETTRYEQVVDLACRFLLWEFGFCSADDRGGTQAFVSLRMGLRQGYGRDDFLFAGVA